jgi:carbon monoxide dehydrogenase subunit G
MKTTINKTFKIEQPIKHVWDFLSDPNKIVTCVPGAKLTEAVDDRQYKGTVTMKIGPVVTSFNGVITLEQLDENNHTMEIHGKGVDTKGKGSANMVLSGKLVDMGNGSTEVTNKMDISVTGKLAQFGSRMIDDVSDQVFKQFVNNFRNQLQVAVSTDPATTPDEAPPAAEAKPLNAVSLFFSMIWASIQKLFGKTPGD